MNNIEIDKLKKLLVDSDKIETEYLQYLKDFYDEYQKAIDNPAEFPVGNEIWHTELDGAESDLTTFSKNLRVQFQAMEDALLKSVAMNNQRILRLLELYVEH